MFSRVLYELNIDSSFNIYWTFNRHCRWRSFGLPLKSRLDLINDVNFGNSLLREWYFQHLLRISTKTKLMFSSLILQELSDVKAVNNDYIINFLTLIAGKIMIVHSMMKNTVHQTASKQLPNTNIWVLL